MIHKYYSPIVKPTKISTIVPFNTSNLRNLSSLLSSLLTSFPLKPPDHRFIRLSLWPFPSQLLPSDLSGFIVLPNTTRYFVPYSKHTTLMCISSLCALLFFVYPILTLLFRPFRYFVTLTVHSVVCCRYLNKDKVMVQISFVWIIFSQ